MGKISYWVVTLMRSMLVEGEDEGEAGRLAITEAVRHPSKFETFITFCRDKTKEDEDKEQQFKGDDNHEAN